MFEGKIECPRCGQIWTIPQAHPGVECNCHLWCRYGTKPADCNLTEINTQTIQWGWPTNMDTDSGDEGDDVVHRRYYCNVHKVYSYKEPIWLEVDWKRWYAKRKLPARLREIGRR